MKYYTKLGEATPALTEALLPSEITENPVSSQFTKCHLWHIISYNIKRFQQKLTSQEVQTKAGNNVPATSSRELSRQVEPVEGQWDKAKSQKSNTQIEQSDFAYIGDR